MNDEHRQSIEAALQSYAEQRRRAWGGPLAMPAHVRSQLQRELERQSAAGSTGVRRGGIFRWRWLVRPWLWAGAAALVVGGWLAWQQYAPANVKYAVAARAPAEKPTVEHTNPPATAVPLNATPTLAPAAAEESGTRTLVTPRRPAGGSELTPEPMAAGRRVSERDLSDQAVPAKPPPANSLASAPAAGSTGPARVPETDSYATRYSPAATPPAPTEHQALLAGDATSGAPTPVSLGVPLAQGGRGVVPVQPRVATAFRQAITVPALQQRYVQAVAAPTIPVLNSFRIEQTGQQIRLVDEDGSVYAATLAEPPAQAASAARAKGPAAAPARAAAPGPAVDRAQSRAEPVSQPAGAKNQHVQTLLLNATGTNLRLQQQVVFNGNLLVTNVTGAPPFANEQALMTNEAALQFLLSNSRLEGQVLLGGTNQFPVLAVPTPR